MVRRSTTFHNPVTLAAVIAGSVFALVTVVSIVVIIWRVCTARKRRSSSYEQIVTSHKRHSKVDTGFLLDGVSSMKQIPFTVPQHTTPPALRRERASQEGFSGGVSEPSSPNGKRPSVEIPGAYALGSIDPSLYKIADEDDDYEIPPEHIGRIWFAVEYERETEKLLVTLIKAKNLPSRMFGGSTGCDPFVRIYLMPDERRYLQSKFKKKCCNPKFEESYVFQVSIRSFKDRVLKFTVFDVDRHKKHNVIGHALYQLKDHDISSENNERLVIWRDLDREVVETTSQQHGELKVSLTYNNHLERITVGIFEGKHFVVEGIATVDSYVKVALMVQNRTIKSKRTGVVKRTEDPNFNESFTFKLPVVNLDTANITITAMQQQSGLKDKIIGRVTIGSFMFARGKELQHWNEMIANQKEQVAYWHALV